MVLFKYYATIVIMVLLALDLFVILLSKFIKRSADENKHDRLARELTIKKWCYIIFLGLTIILLLINAVF